MSEVDVASLSAAQRRKHIYRERLKEYLETYKNILIITVDFVGSKQMQEVRMALRGKAKVLMGKNTIIRRLFQEQMDKFPFLSDLLPLIRGNMGFIFTNDSLVEIKKIVTSNKVPAAAKSGVVAPVDVTIPAGPTPLDPGQTSFFQALNIATKISRGAIEIVNAIKVVTAGEPCLPGPVALLNKLGIKPFFFGIEVTQVCDDGNVYAAAVLDMTEEDLINRFVGSANLVASISLMTGVPNLTSLPHSIKYAFKKLVAIALETDVMFEEAKAVKALM